jgi:hypothetical protein
VLADVLDLDRETSIWRVDALDAPEIKYIIAALHQESAVNLSDMTLRFVSEWRLQKIGVTKKQLRGECLDSTLNNGGRHWVVTVNTVEDAIKFAKSFKSLDEQFFRRDEVLKCFATSVLEGRIKTDKITAGLWKKLIDERHLRLI